MEAFKDIVLVVSLLANGVAIAKNVLDGRRTLRDVAKQADAERQLAKIVKTLQKPEMGGINGVVFNKTLRAGAELGVAKGILTGTWHNGSLWVRFATFSGGPDDTEDDVEDVERGDRDEEQT